MSKKPTVLSFDFETSPAKGYFFGSIWETNIIQTIEHEQILCVAWKEHGSKKVHVIGQCDFKDYKPGVLNDKSLVLFFRDIIMKYDLITAHNGDRFDLTVFNTRLLAHGIDPIPHTKCIDTKKIAKSKFHLPSNKLDDIADFLKIGRKLSTHKNLWFGCERGEVKDWMYMKRYCVNDVVLQDKVLEYILPFAKQSFNFNTFTTGGIACTNPLCGSSHVQKRGFARTNTCLYQRYQCQGCGAWLVGEKIPLDQPIGR